MRVTVDDGKGNPPIQSPEFVVQTGPPGFDGLPEFDIWYGQPNAFGEMVQSFGRPGRAQTWANVLGNVRDELGAIVSLTYELNDSGVLVPLSVKAVDEALVPYRLERAGDFNAELPFASLIDDSVGLNELQLTATDNDGNVVTETVWIDCDLDSSWPLPSPDGYQVDWSTVTDLQQAVQVVDGYFELDVLGGTGGNVPALRNTSGGLPKYGYDRLFAVGDATWTDYEFEFPFTIHSLDPDGFHPVSGSHAFGVIFRWPGHNGGTQQPREGFFPIGGLFAYRWWNPGSLEYWQFYSTNYNPKVSLSNFFMPVEEGLTYKLRGECETVGGISHYRLQLWEITSPDPPPDTWFFEVDVPSGDERQGSLLFIIHEVDASVGPIVVKPL